MKVVETGNGLAVQYADKPSEEADKLIERVVLEEPSTEHHLGSVQGTPAIDPLDMRLALAAGLGLGYIAIKDVLAISSDRAQVRPPNAHSISLPRPLSGEMEQMLFNIQHGQMGSRSAIPTTHIQHLSPLPRQVPNPVQVVRRAPHVGAGGQALSQVLRALRLLK
jgi:hypothetical protein